MISGGRLRGESWPGAVVAGGALIVAGAVARWPVVEWLEISSGGDWRGPSSSRIVAGAVVTRSQFKCVTDFVTNSSFSLSCFVFKLCAEN